MQATGNLFVDFNGIQASTLHIVFESLCLSFQIARIGLLAG
jgi:hypothetical protein